MSTDASTLREVAAELGRRAVTDDDFNALLAHLVQEISDQLQVEFSSFLEVLSAGAVLFWAGVGWKPGIPLTPFMQQRLRAESTSLYAKYQAVTERHLLKLEHAGGNLSKAARILGI